MHFATEMEKKMAKANEPKIINVASIVLGALSIVPIFWVLPIGAIFGIIGLALHDKRGDRVGFGLSLAGTIIGCISLAVWIVFIVLAAQNQ
jgi:hypothetical protein